MIKKLESLISEVPRQIRSEAKIENVSALSPNPNALFVCGMGGSGIIGNLLQGLFPEIPIVVHKNYGIPKLATEAKGLVLVISYSGRTEEAISAFEEAMASNLQVAVVSGGGTLLEEAKKRTVPYVAVPYEKDVPARFKIAYKLRAALEIMEGVGFIDSAKDYVRPLEKVQISLEGTKKRAQNIKGATALLYAGTKFQGVAQAWKEILNETAKLPAFVNVLPEMNHNEIESIGSIKHPFIFLFKDYREHQNIIKRFEIIEAIAKEYKWDHETFVFEKPERIVDMVASIMQALATGLELAELKNVDPVATPIIDKIKKRL